MKGMLCGVAPVDVKRKTRSCFSFPYIDDDDYDNYQQRP
jgi:hypothetical protein